MRIHYRKRNESTWKVIPNVITPIAISDVADDTFDNAKFSFLVSEDDIDFTDLKSLRPKTYIRITETNEDSEINDFNTYYFITTRLPKGKIRNDLELWEIEVTGMELIKETEDYNSPNYTITQPKTQFFNRYRRTLVDRYNFNQNFDYSVANQLTFGTNTKNNINQANNGGVITTYYDSGTLKVRYNNISTESCSINVNLNWERTATTTRPAWGISKNIIPMVKSSYQDFGSNDTTIVFTNNYYDSSNTLINTSETEVHATYIGGEVTMSGILGSGNITSLGGVRLTTVSGVVNKLENASYCITTIKLVKKYPVSNKSANFTDASTIWLETRISGFNNDDFVKARIDTIELDVVSSQLSEQQEEEKTTLLDFVQKALYDYNFNKRNKLTLGDDVKVLLDVFAKESEWNGYNFRELLVRAFKYVGAIPYLTIDRQITHIKPTPTSYNLEVNQQSELNENIVDEDYYDTIVSTAKNVVSDNDFMVENAVVGSGTDDFVQITNDNATFRLNSPIYYISKAIVYMPDLTFNIPLDGGGSYDINTNMGKPFYWDITKRVLDVNHYKSLPNVNFTSKEGRTSGELSQANTICFNSGDRNIEKLGHRGANIPSFNALSTNYATQTQFAFFEMLICLAYEWIIDNTGYDVNDFQNQYNPSNLDVDKMLTSILTLTFVPYHKELTTKYISSKEDRKGLNYQKKVSISDRTIDFKENEIVLTKEMNRKGNVSYITNGIMYSSLMETIPAGSIINNGKFVVTSRRILMYNDFVEVEYTLDREIVNQNTDVGLSVEYSPYNVPYEYVLREMFIDCHLLFDNKLSNYRFEPRVINERLVEDIFKPQLGWTTEGEIYARYRMRYSDNSTKLVLMNVKKLTSKFTMILSGQFIDNYNAGNQRYVVSGQGSYTQPFSYVDFRGQIKSIELTHLGYTPNQTYRLPSGYDFTKFPTGTGAVFSRNYLVNEIEIGNLKDSREALSLNCHVYLESLNENIRFYNFKPINAIATLRGDVKLIDDLEFDNIPCVYYDGEDAGLSFTYDSVLNHIEMSVTKDITVIPTLANGIVLLNKTNEEITLVGVIKNPILENTGGNQRSCKFYIYPTRYGIK